MAGSLHYFKLMQRDHLASASIQSLSWAAQGVLTNLRCHHWESGALPLDEDKLLRLIGGGAKEARKVWSELIPLFSKTDAGYVFGLDAEQRAETVDKIERNKNRDPDHAGGRPRGKRSETGTKPNGFGNETNTKHTPESEYIEPNGSPLCETATPSAKRERSWTDEKEAVFLAWFDAFKLAYPKRHGGNFGWPKAEERLRTLFKQGLAAGKVMDGLARYKAMLEAEGKVGGRFVKMASSWVNAYGWDDDYPTILVAVDGGGPSKPPMKRLTAEEKARMAR